jgi:hypothetical protein
MRVMRRENGQEIAALALLCPPLGWTAKMGDGDVQTRLGQAGCAPRRLWSSIKAYSEVLRLEEPW